MYIFRFMNSKKICITCESTYSYTYLGGHTQNHSHFFENFDPHPIIIGRILVLLHLFSKLILQLANQNAQIWEISFDKINLQMILP